MLFRALGMWLGGKKKARTFGHRTSNGTTESGASYRERFVASCRKLALSDREKINTLGLAHTGL